MPCRALTTQGAIHESYSHHNRAQGGQGRHRCERCGRFRPVTICSPRGFAIVADKRQLGALDKRNARVAAKTAGEKSMSQDVKGLLDGKTIRIPRSGR